jgi:PAS domain S-box-containing protein
MHLKLATRITLLNLTICMGIGLIIAVQILSYQRVEGLLRQISQDHMEQVVLNAHNSRALTYILADINLLTRTFYEREKHLKLTSSRILSDLTRLGQTNQDPQVADKIRQLTFFTRSFLEQCRIVNQVLADRHAVEQDLNQHLNDIEAVVTDLIIEAALDGEDATFIEQISLHVFEYRESLLNIGKRFAELGYNHFTDPFVGQNRPINDLLSELEMRLRILTAENARIQKSVAELRAGISRYGRTIDTLYGVMRAFRITRQELRDSQGQLLKVMADVDYRLSESAGKVDRVIQAQLERTSAIMGALAVAILVVLIVASTLFFTEHVKRPLATIQEGITDFSKGLLDHPIDLQRQDEWGTIEAALNRMAQELLASYTALELSEKSYRSIFENVNEGIYQIEATADGSCFTKANPALARLLGFGSPQEAIQAYNDLGAQLFVTPGDKERLLKTLREREHISGFECQLRDRSGRPLWVAIGARLMADEGDGRHTIEGTMVDISGRKAAETALRESEDRYRTLVQASPSPIIVHHDNRIVFANGAAARCLDAESASDLVGRRTTEFIHPDFREIANERIARIYGSGNSNGHRADGNLPVIEEKYTTLAGNTIDVLVAAVAITYEEQRAAQVVFQDISEHKRAEKEMQRLRKLLHNITDAMPSVLVAVDAEERITQWNREAQRLTGITTEAALGSPLHQALPQIADQRARIADAISKRPFEPQATIRLTVSGEERTTDMTVYSLTDEDTAGAVIRLDDVTDRVRMKEMMIQSEKMLSVGGLAAGMAHEINNPLAGILQNIQVIENRLLGNLPQNERTAAACGIEMPAMIRYLEERHIPEMLVSVSDSGKRAARIVDNMLSFARKGDSERSSNDLAALIDLTVELAENDYDLKKKLDFRHISIEKEYDEAMPPILCSSSKIQQVLLNLLRNGAQAMAAARTEAPRFRLRLLRKGEMARIEIEDNGPGMDETTRRRVFEPCFTTKDVGVGTGLGLSVSYFIITENHKGTMSVTSQPGKGSTFAIELPMNPY